jgi:hypothetical protein
MAITENNPSADHANGPIAIRLNIHCLAALRVQPSPGAGTVLVSLAAEPGAIVSLLPSAALDLAARLVEAAADVRTGGGRWRPACPSRSRRSAVST